MDHPPRETYQSPVELRPRLPHEPAMIQFNCPGCQASYSVSDERAGKQGKCPKCRTPFTVPAPTASSPPSRETEPEDDRPRKRAARREEVEDEPPHPERTPKAKLSSLDGALRMIRRGQFLDLAAVLSLLLVGGVLAVMLTVVANSKQQARADEWDRRANEHTKAWDEWRSQPPHKWNTRGPQPTWPSDLPKWKPLQKYAAREMLAEQGWLFLLIALPAIIIVASSSLAMVGRFRLASVSAGSGGGRGFAAVGVLALAKGLLGLAAIGGCVWAMTQAGEVADNREKIPELVAASVGGLILSFYVGVIGEVFALPALALAGWFHRTTDKQRGRIGTAAAFYPVVVIGWFLLTLAFTALAIFIPDSRLIVGGVQGILFLVIQVLQYLVLSRAYRFPPAADAVN